MKGCIFGNYCTEPFCDRSCPINAEVSYLLERNGILQNSSVFKTEPKEIEKVQNILQKSFGSYKYIRTNPMASIKVAELYAYCGICNHWKGSQLHCTVYTLKFAKYVEDLKQSWNIKKEAGEVSELDYIKIWAENSKLLIVTGFDFVKLGEFESQMLSNLLQRRLINSELTTIFVGSDIDSLIGSSDSFIRLKDTLRRGVV